MGGLASNEVMDLGFSQEAGAQGFGPLLVDREQHSSTDCGELLGARLQEAKTSSYLLHTQRCVSCPTGLNTVEICNIQ